MSNISLICPPNIIYALNRSILKIILIFLLFTLPQSAQNIHVPWSSFSPGFGESVSSNSKLKSIVGDQLIGNSANTGSIISSGFFSNTLFALIITGKNNEMLNNPSSFELYQNYPNPFNPSTNIKFSLPVQSNIKVVIYDLLGRKVKTLLDEIRPAGNIIIQWNGENEFNTKVSSGIYFYSLNALGIDNNKFTSFKKMILLK